MAQAIGIKPISSVLETDVLSLHYTRMGPLTGVEPTSSTAYILNRHISGVEPVC